MEKNGEQTKSKGNKFLNFFFPESVKRPLIIIGVIVAIAIILGMVLENTHFIGASKQNLSGFFREQFALRNGTGDEAKKFSFGYLLYYIILYLGVVLYVASSLYICTQKESKNWCALNIAIGIIFMIAADAWLTLTLQYNEGTLYNVHLLCYISVATVISSISAGRMSKIIKTEKP